MEKVMFKEILRVFLSALLLVVFLPLQAIADPEKTNQGSGELASGHFIYLPEYDDGSFEGMSPEEIRAVIGKPDEDSLSFEWDLTAEGDAGIALMSLGEGTASDIVDIAVGEADGVPSGGDRNKYNSYNGEPWCAYFVVWCARQAGVPADVIPSYYYCDYLVDYYKDRGLWHSYSYTPKPGDLIFYSESRGGAACHVGLVTRVANGYVYTKEGNTSGDEVSSRARKVGANWVWHGWYVKGYASPKYATHSHSFPVEKYEPYGDSQHKVVYGNCACGSAREASIQTCTYEWSGLAYRCAKCGSEHIAHKDGEYIAQADIEIYGEGEGLTAIATIPRNTIIKISGATLNLAGRYVASVEFNEITGYVFLGDLMFNGSAGKHNFIDSACADCEVPFAFAEPGIYLSDRKVVLYKSDVLSNSQKTVEAGKEIFVNQVGITSDGWYWGYTPDGYVLDMCDLTCKISSWPTNDVAPVVDKGIYSFLLADDALLAIDIPSASTLESRDAQIYSYNGSAAQQFNVIGNEDGTYRIQSVNSGLVLGVRDWMKGSGAIVRQDAWCGEDYQRWHVEIGPDGAILLRLKASNLYLGVADVNIASKSKLVQCLPSDSATCAFTMEKISTSTFSRLAGSNRYDTMSAIVAEGFANDSCEWVIVASGADFPDALAASSLAGALNAPVVLTSPSSLSVQAFSEIKRVGASKVIVVGGPNAVSDNVVKQLNDMQSVSSVKRVYGNNRYATALAIYEEGMNLGVEWSSTAIVASGEAFADALSISPYSYASGSPIFLAYSTTGLDEATASAIAGSGFSRVVIVGGEKAVPAPVEANLSNWGVLTKRVSGSNRYETSLSILKWAMDEEGVLGVSSIAFATGTNFPDALAGGALCGSRGSALLLLDPNDSSMIEWAEPGICQADHVYVFGGPNAVSTSVIEKILDAIEANSRVNS